MENMIHAGAARAIAEQHDEDKMIEEIMGSIAKRAEDGKFFLQVRNFGFSNYESHGKPLNARQQRVVDKLHELGYKTEVKYEEKQFVDIYLEIRW